MFKPRFDGQAAHIVPPIAPYHAGPSGMVYNPGTALSEAWRNHFLVTSFPGAAANARVYAFRLKPDGAGFALDRDTVVLRGILTVGMKFGPDGALYLTDWITGWRSKNSGRLWKLDATQGSADPARREVATLLPQDFSTRAVADLAPLLRHADMRIRLKAQFELARRGDAQTLLAASRDTSHRLGRVHGLWGLGQLARADRRQAAVLTAFLNDTDDEIVAQAAKLRRRRASRAGRRRAAPAARAHVRRASGFSPRRRSDASPTSPPSTHSSECSPTTTIATCSSAMPAASRCRESATPRTLGAALAPSVPRRPHRRHRRAQAHASCRRRPLPGRRRRGRRDRGRARDQRRRVDCRRAAGARAAAGREAGSRASRSSGARSTRICGWARARRSRGWRHLAATAPAGGDARRGGQRAWRLGRRRHRSTASTACISDRRHRPDAAMSAAASRRPEAHEGVPGTIESSDAVKAALAEAAGRLERQGRCADPPRPAPRRHVARRPPGIAARPAGSQGREHGRAHAACARGCRPARAQSGARHSSRAAVDRGRQGASISPPSSRPARSRISRRPSTCSAR